MNERVAWILIVFEAGFALNTRGHSWAAIGRRFPNQLQIQHACEFEVSVLLDFVGCHATGKSVASLTLFASSQDPTDPTVASVSMMISRSKS